ncbi:MAG: class I SAM-dependent methyltransferase [Alteromonadales bacterium]|nr:class I SAM-dependent methyltransferase [Alteromonadales bacterium]
MKKNLFGFIRAIGKRVGSNQLKTKIWNYENSKYGEFLHEYGEGYRSRICDWIEKYCAGGLILDLGCSDGHVGYSLRSGYYTKYIGVDLSSMAIKRAINKNSDLKEAKDNQYIVNDIFTYEPDEVVDVVLFKDAIYYASNNVILNCLKRLSNKLSNEGVFIVHMDNIVRHVRIKELIHNNFNVVEENSQLDSTGLLIIFR